MLKSFTSTKERLLKVLKRANESSMKDIMEHFELSEIAIRRHLQDLIRNRLVEERSVRQEVGRPYKVYRLTDKGRGIFPNQYKQLPVELLQDLEETQGKAAVTSLLEKRKERERERFSSRIKSKDFDKRIHELVQVQKDNGYMVELNKIKNGYEIINYNCPIDNIASSYLQICHHEKEVYSSIFSNCVVKSHSKIAEGDCRCKWTIFKPEAK